MNFKLTLFFFTFAWCVNNVFQMEITSNYGPFELDFESITTCKGPKNRNCGVLEFQLHNPGVNSVLEMVLELLKDCPFSHVKVTANSIEKVGAKKLFNYVVEKPCQHFYFGPTLKALMNITDNCVLKKGTYRVNLDINQMIKKFFGEKFFYGSYMFKTVAVNANENIMCTKVIMNFQKAEI